MNIPLDNLERSRKGLETNFSTSISVEFLSKVKEMQTGDEIFTKKQEKTKKKLNRDQVFIFSCAATV